jgi:hypothetical protein
MEDVGFTTRHTAVLSISQHSASSPSATHRSAPHLPAFHFIAPHLPAFRFLSQRYTRQCSQSPSISLRLPARHTAVLPISQHSAPSLSATHRSAPHLPAFRLLSQHGKPQCSLFPQIPLRFTNPDFVARIFVIFYVFSPGSIRKSSLRPRQVVNFVLVRTTLPQLAQCLLHVLYYVHKSIIGSLFVIYLWRILSEVITVF